MSNVEQQVIRDPAVAKQLLDSMPLFAELSDRERNILAAVFVVRIIEEAEELCREGDRGTSFYIVAKGVIEVYKELPGGSREKLAEIGPNNLIGQVALIDGKPRSATCQARGRSIALECTRTDFDQLFRSGSPFAFKVVDQVVIDLAKRLREANLQLQDIDDGSAESGDGERQRALSISQTINA